MLSVYAFFLPLLLEEKQKTHVCSFFFSSKQTRRRRIYYFLKKRHRRVFRKMLCVFVHLYVKEEILNVHHLSRVYIHDVMRKDRRSVHLCSFVVMYLFRESLLLLTKKTLKRLTSISFEWISVCEQTYSLCMPSSKSRKSIPFIRTNFRLEVTLSFLRCHSWWTLSLSLFSVIIIVIFNWRVCEWVCQSFVGQESLPNVSLFSFFHELSESFNEKARPKA